jgi:signal transduction histidine kinase
MGRKQVAPSARALVAAFACVAVSFLMATVASEWSDVRIRSDAALITASAAPSIVHLEAFRSEARRLVVLADDEIDRSVERQRQRAQAVALARRPARATAAPGRATQTTNPPPAGAVTAAPPDLTTNGLGAIATSTERLEREWTAYRSLALLPRGQQLAALAADVKAQFIEDLARALAALRVQDAPRALEILERRVKPAADALDDATVELVERNAQEANALAGRINRLGRRSIALALGLDALSVVLTIIAALLVLRFLRRYARLVEQRAEELELFASRVAHDILSPLGAASLALSYLTSKDEIDDPRARKMLALGLRGIERTRVIADDLLEFASAGARPDPTARAEVRAIVAAVVEEARPLADERQIVLVIDGVAVGSVCCSRGILSSLVSNLVRNAVKYVGAGPGKVVRVRVRIAGGFTRIEVEDNGPGLPPRMELAVFEPYVRGPDNQQPGIGLGLATVKRITEAHGGRVAVRSTPGFGCCFAIELPSAAAGLDGAAAAPESSSPQNPLPTPGNPPRVGPEDERLPGVAAEDPNPTSHVG